MPAPKKMQRSTVDIRDIHALLAHDPAPLDVIEKAFDIKEQALLEFGLGASTMNSVLYSRCYHHVPTTAIPTAAVVLLADGTTMLLYNPHFAVDLGVQDLMFVLFHEARHLIMRHLFNEPYLRKDPLFTTATEACINHVSMVRLGRTSMPTASVTLVDPKTGKETTKREPTGIDPKAVYKKYVDDLTGQSLSPVSYADFIATDFGCFHELKRMKNPPENGSGAGGVGECIHQDDDGGDDGVPMDGETVEQAGKDVLGAVMKHAMAGKKDARNELIELGERTEGSTDRVSKIWGDLGLGRLRGETLATRRVDWWKQWFNDTLASKIEPGQRLIYVKKRGAIDLMLGNSPMLLRRGDDELKVVAVAIDTSGSMPDHVLEYLTKLVGSTDGIEIHWLAFDGVVQPFVAGEKVSGGGGTNFANVMDYIEGRAEINGHRMAQHPDAVVMLTDGYASPIQPQRPESWMWLITEGGDDDWIASQSPRMDSYKLKTGEGTS